MAGAHATATWVLLACKLLPAAATGLWEGWATTTQFGSGDGPWGDNPATQVYVNVLNNETAGRMAAAVPWRFYFKWYGSKAGETSAVYGSITGANSLDACFLMQPISYYPSQVTGTSDGGPVACSGSACVDINDDRLAASYLDAGVRRVFPEYLIVPFEGCGGDCKSPPDGPGPDCMNSCAQGTDFVSAIKGDFSATTGSACTAMRVLCGGSAQLSAGTSCTWPWDDTVKSNFLKYSEPLGCSRDTAWGQTAAASGQHVNWCSGQNMHFDIAMDSPLYKRDGSNAAQTTDPSNIVVRYRRVSCAIRGTFNPQDLCASSSVSCGANGHCLPSTGTCQCNEGYSGATCSDAVKCKGVTCPTGHRCRAADGTCMVIVAPAVDLCVATRWTCQDTSAATALASWCTNLLQQTSRVYCSSECASTSDMSVCAACIAQIYGLAGTCTWSSPSSPSATTTQMSSASSTSRTTLSTVKTTTTSSTTSRGPSSTTSRASSSTTSSAPSWTTSSAPSSTTSRASSLTTSKSTSSTVTSSPQRLAPSASLCVAAQWTCQDPSLVSAMASWCTGSLQQPATVYCVSQCAASSDMATCAACIAQLYGMSCAWSAPAVAPAAAASQGGQPRRLLL